MTMTNKKMLAILLASVGKTQADAAEILNKFPQSLNMTVNNNNLRVCELLTICDALNISIDFKDSNNNIVLSIRSSRRDKTDKTDA
ncbi:hypothetical protein [uncultured Dialister sp.]|uniref:hypothetical protein n=1 Tax=uncultured Dialister sp. TaxID=278064 RepID=UPI0026723FBF|nr:hypothetical protein [uncultured Dialister sp.]